MGRKGLEEILNATCTTRTIMLQGGQSSSNPDDISIPTNAPSCPYNLTIQVEGHTKIQSSALHGEITIAVQRSENTSFIASIMMTPTISHKFYVAVRPAEIEPIVINPLSKRSQETFFTFSFKSTLINQIYEISIDFGGVKSSIPNQSENKFGLLLYQDPGKTSMLTFYDERNYLVVHQLRIIPLTGIENGKYTNNETDFDFAQGSPSISNEFHLISGYWFAIGGAHSNDSFYFYPECSGTIDGGGGGSNTLKIMGTYKPVSILYKDLRQCGVDPDGYLHYRTMLWCGAIKTYSKQSIVALNIQKLVGRPGAQETLKMTGLELHSKACRDKIVISLEGGEKDLPDRIEISNKYEEEICFPPLKIVVMSYTIVQIDFTRSQIFSPIIFFIRTKAKMGTWT